MEIEMSAIGEVCSRYTSINMQHAGNDEYRLVGPDYPNVSLLYRWAAVLEVEVKD